MSRPDTSFLPHLLVVLLALAAPAARAQSVHVVDAAAGPGSDFTSLQSAIDAAADGDSILVRSGAYVGPGGPFFPGPITINGKSLAIEADAGATVTLGQGMLVQNVDASRWLFVRGLTVACDKTFTASNCAGPLWFEEITVPGSCAGVASQTFAGTFNCQQVVLDRCSFSGGGGFPFAQTTSNAFQITSSSVHAYDSSFHGGGSNGVSPSSYGLRIVSGFLMASGCSFQGGGVNGGVPCGGPGLWLGAGSPTVWLRDDTIVGGEGGCFSALQVDSGSALPMSGTARHFDAGSPVRGGATSTVSFDGEAGDVLLLMLSLEPGTLFKFGLGGTLQLGLPLLTTLVLGPLASGDPLVLSAPTAPLPPGIEGFVVFVQAGYWQGPGQLVLAGGSAQLFLDASF